MKIGEFEQALRYDPNTSGWLREQFEITLQRDPVEALNDAEALVSALKARIRINSEDQK